MADEMKKPCSNTLYPLRPVSKPSNIINKPGDLHSCVSQIITRCIRRFFQLICHCCCNIQAYSFLNPVCTSLIRLANSLRASARLVPLSIISLITSAFESSLIIFSLFPSIKQIFSPVSICLEIQPSICSGVYFPAISFICFIST